VSPSPLRALVRRPSPRLAEALLTHRDHVAADVERAIRQWADYVAALNAAGWRTIEVPPAHDSPDGVFVEDTMVVFADLAVIARSGAPSRRAEITDAEATVAAATPPCRTSG
jgi:dimethylargininase